LTVWDAEALVRGYLREMNETGRLAPLPPPPDDPDDPSPPAGGLPF
jgi:hypothetical protein